MVRDFVHPQSECLVENVVFNGSKFTRHLLVARLTLGFATTIETKGFI